MVANVSQSLPACIRALPEHAFGVRGLSDGRGEAASLVLPLVRPHRAIERLKVPVVHWSPSRLWLLLSPWRGS